MGRGLAREEYQYLERPYRDWLPHRRVLGSWVTPPADDSSLVAYCLPKIDRHYAVRRDRWPAADGKSLRQASPRQLPRRHPGTIAAISPVDTHRHGRFPSPIYVSECKSRSRRLLGGKFLRRRRAWKRR